jgi:hypothetical protein
MATASARIIGAVFGLRSDTRISPKKPCSSARHSTFVFSTRSLRGSGSCFVAGFEALTCCGLGPDRAARLDTRIAAGSSDAAVMTRDRLSLDCFAFPTPFPPCVGGPTKKRPPTHQRVASSASQDGRRSSRVSPVAGQPRITLYKHRRSFYSGEPDRLRLCAGSCDRNRSDRMSNAGS